MNVTDSRHFALLWLRNGKLRMRWLRRHDFGREQRERRYILDDSAHALLITNSCTYVLVMGTSEMYQKRRAICLHGRLGAERDTDLENSWRVVVRNSRFC